ncbi:tRNA lysidine(34) synthetase TilS [Nocardioides sp.]|uniref:tRNA lysidine(34) synthetase TilS n=1 Tax=Nocardioides sp. TaxID=35761 RepID=UPI002B276866|nr:tRNA lysidine(34) synthetase TilS [Nocardioides sp.]
MSLDPAVAAVRLAVRRGLPVLSDGAGGRWVPETDVVVVACSGGADSLALLAATVFELRRTPVRVVGAIVDHGLQDDSAAHTARVVGQMAALGVDETVGARVQVDPGGRGVEAAAREARYAVLGQVAESFGAQQVLLGHTLDDQAETALLGLTRGSGGRSVAGMRPRFSSPAAAARPADPPTTFVRPLLGVRRAQTEAACRAEGIDFWVDPHNSDPRFTRSRVRHTVLPLLERELGPGVAETLARTAEQLRPDMELLDSLAEAALVEHDHDGSFDVRALETLAQPVRTRLLRLAALRAGCPPSELFAVHVDALEEQVWNRDKLPRTIQLPGHVSAVRSGDHLRFGPTDPAVGPTP